MLSMVYIIRIDDKDFLVTTSVVERNDYLDKLKQQGFLQLSSVEERAHSKTYQFTR